jgi:hypothetical protein
MKKIRLLMFAVFAVSALGAVLAASAFAETTLEAKWLVGATGVNITEALATETSGEILLEDTKAGPFGEKAAVLCSAILDGIVGPNGADLVELVLNLKNEEIVTLGLALLGTGAGSDCVTVALCLEGTVESPIEVWPENLPWRSLLFLMEGATGKILDTVFGAAYELLCLTVLGNAEDLCEGDASFEILNDPETGDAEVPAGALGEPLATCTLGGAGSGVNETDVLAFILLAGSTELLAVSSE